MFRSFLSSMIGTQSLETENMMTILITDMTTKMTTTMMTKMMTLMMIMTALVGIFMTVLTMIGTQSLETEKRMT